MWFTRWSLNIPPHAAMRGIPAAAPSMLHFNQPIRGEDHRTSMVLMFFLGLIVISKCFKRNTLLPRHSFVLKSFLIPCIPNLINNVSNSGMNYRFSLIRPIQIKNLFAILYVANWERQVKDSCQPLPYDAVKDEMLSSFTTSVTKAADWREVESSRMQLIIIWKLITHEPPNSHIMSKGRIFVPWERLPRRDGIGACNNIVGFL